MKEKALGSLPRLVPPEQTAHLLRVSLSQVNRYQRQGLLTPEYPHGRKGGRYFRVSDIEDLLTVFTPGNLTAHEMKTLCLKALVSARRSEQKLDELLAAMGLSEDRLPTDREGLLGALLEVHALRGENLRDSPGEAARWARLFLSVTEEYLALVAEWAGEKEPWVPYLRAATHLHGLFHEGRTGALLGHAARHLRHVAYFYVRGKSGELVARERFPEGLLGKMIGVLFPE